MVQYCCQPYHNMLNKFSNRLKALLYKYSSLKQFRLIEEVISRPFLKPIIPASDKIGKTKKPFYIILTIDTEAGYVKRGGQRKWQVDNPDFFQGFYFGIENWLNLLDKHNIKATFMLSSQCFSAKKNERLLINRELNHLIKNNHELGYHLHPKSDYSLEKKLGEKLKFTGSKFYSTQKINMILRAVRLILRENLGKEANRQIKSFRWGNFSLFPHAIKPLEKNSFLIDSSVCPKLVRHQNDDMYCNWSKINTPFPFMFRGSKILEIPVTTFTFLNKTFTVDPVYHFWLKQIFNSYRLLNNKIDNKKPFFFVLHSHSSEATYKNGGPTKIVTTMEKFIKEVKQIKNVSFITLKEAYKIYHSSKP